MKNKILIVGGLLLIAAALLLTMNNVLESKRAGKTADDLLERIEDMKASESNITAENNEKDIKEADVQAENAESAADVQNQSEDEEIMPVISVDGLNCIGILRIPDLELALPVLNDLSDDLLKRAPCRYSGSIQDNNLVIAGHNYRAHFQKIKWMEAGQRVTFTDLSGNKYEYVVTAVEQIPGEDIEGMLAGDWDMTLFTCTTSRVARAAVRCRRVN